MCVWLQLNGVWVNLDGVRSSVPITPERPTSALTTIDGHRYVQQAPEARRSWELNLQHATPAAVAALRVAAEATSEVRFFLESAANMLRPDQTHGDGVVIDAGGIPLPTFAGGESLEMAVRDGETYTLVWWSDTGQDSATFVADGETSGLTAGAGNAGYMLLEGTPSPLPEVFSAGESMPCQVNVHDPGEVLLYRRRDVWRHDYTVILSEVG